MERQPFLVLVLVFATTLFACSPAPTQAATEPAQSVTIYFYDPQSDLDASGNVQCSPAGLVAAPRALDPTLESEALIRATIELLLSGQLTEAEADRGLTTEFPLEGVALDDVDLEDGLLSLRFRDPQFQTSGGACRVSVLRAQIEATALQFGEVREVVILPEDLFQP